MPTGIYKHNPNSGFQKGHKINIGRKHSEESKRKISDARKGIHISEETRKKMVEACKKRLPISEETRQKLSKARIERKKRLGYLHSTETRKKISANHARYWLGKKQPTGENAYNWKGGVTSKRIIIMSTPQYILWRKSVFERDNYTCRQCNQVGGKLNAHHIKPFKDFEQDRLNINNGLILCNKCHKIWKNKELWLCQIEVWNLFTKGRISNLIFNK